LGEAEVEARSVKPSVCPESSYYLRTPHGALRRRWGVMRKACSDVAGDDGGNRRIGTWELLAQYFLNNLPRHFLIVLRCLRRHAKGGGKGFEYSLAGAQISCGASSPA
jgi:hypothetical protein